MQEPERIDVYTARRRVMSGEALLVCGYAERKKFLAARLEGAIAYPELCDRLAKLPHDADIVLYCA